MRSGLQALSWWVRRLPDCDAAGVFWRDVVGLPLLGQKGSGYDEEGSYFLFHGGAFLEFELLPGGAPRPRYTGKEEQSAVPVFRTYAFDATLERLLAGGAELLELVEDAAGRTAYVLEPDGSIDGLREPRAGSVDPLDVAAAAEHAAGGTVLAGAKPMPAGLLDIGWVLLPVVDVTAQLAFYRDVVGLDVLADDGSAGAVLALGELGRLELCPGGRLQQVPADRLEADEMWMLRVHDLDGLTADLHAKGVHFVHEPWRAASGRLAYFTDPEGHLVGVQDQDQDGRAPNLEAHRRWHAQRPASSDQRRSASTSSG